MTGLPRRVIFDRHVREVFDEDIAGPLLANNAVVREHGRHRFREVVPTAGSEPRTYVTEKFPLSDDGRVAGVSVDITDQVTAEQQLRERQTVLDAVTRQSADMLTLHDLPSGRVRWASAGSRALLGYSPDDLIGTTPEEWLVLDDPAGLVAELGEAARAGRPMLLRRRARTTDGEVRWVEINMRPTDLDPETGHLRAAVATLRDITGRHSEYEELQREVQQHQTDLELMHHVLEAVADPVAIEDLQTGEVVFTNSPMAAASRSTSSSSASSTAAASWPSAWPATSVTSSSTSRSSSAVSASSVPWPRSGSPASGSNIRTARGSGWRTTTRRSATSTGRSSATRRSSSTSRHGRSSSRRGQQPWSTNAPWRSSSGAPWTPTRRSCAASPTSCARR